MRERDQYEGQNLGNYRRCYPNDDQVSTLNYHLCKSVHCCFFVNDLWFLLFGFRRCRLNMSSWCSIRRWCGMCLMAVNLRSSPYFSKLSCTDRLWMQRRSLAFKPSNFRTSGKHGTSKTKSHSGQTPPTCCNRSRLPRRVLATPRVSWIDSAIVRRLRASVIRRS